MLHCVNAERRLRAVERMFGRMKEWRRPAIRYDRLAGSFLSAIELIASASFWLA